MIFNLLSISPPCDSARLPLVFVHGFLGSGDTWAEPCRRFRSAGYCADRLFVFDWNSTGGRQKTDSLLDLFIDDVLRKTAAPQVNLAGHSAGGGLCYKYLRDSVHSSKVAHYVHLGSGKLNGPAGPGGGIPTLVIQSKDDKVTGNFKESPGSVNITLEGKDHLEVATCEESFREMFRFFNDKEKEPAMLNEAMETKVRVAGKVLTLGENKPLPYQAVYVYYLEPSTGRRKKPMADHILVTDENGQWPAFFVSSAEHLEFQIRPKNTRSLSYFTGPIPRDNPLIYLRCFPESGLLAGFLKKIPADEFQTALAIFSSRKAIIAGRDSLAIDSVTLSTADLMPAEKTTIAAFLFDDGDGKSDMKAMTQFGAGIFMNGIDYRLPASANGYSRIYYNGRTLAIPRRPSKEGVLIAVFD